MSSPAASTNDEVDFDQQDNEEKPTDNERRDGRPEEIVREKRLFNPPAEHMRGLCGLQNLGNTCFMNSALQCLSNVPELTAYFLEDKYMDEINVNNPLGTGGHLVKDYAELLKEMWSGHFTSVRPNLLKQTIGRFAPRFTGHAQHDSQELTAFLLDGLHEDLNRIKQKPYVEEKELSGQDEAEAAKQSWEDHRKRNDSIIVDLLHGQHKSTLTCNVCCKISIKFEPFCFLSVPVPTKELKLHSTVIFIRVEKWAKFYVAHTSKTTAGQLKHMLREQLQLPSNTKIVVFMSGNGRLLTDDSLLTVSHSAYFTSKIFAYAVEPGPLIMVDSCFGNSCVPLFLPRPAKLTRRAVLAELVPRVRELCLSLSSLSATAAAASSSSSSSSSFIAGECSTAAGAAAAPSCSSSALVIALPAPPGASTSLSPSNYLSMSSSSSSSPPAASSSSTVAALALPAPAAVSSCSSVSSTLSPPPPPATASTTKSFSSTGPTMGATSNNNDGSFSSYRLSGAGGSASSPSSQTSGGVAGTAVGLAALPSSSSQSSPANDGRGVVVTSTNGGAVVGALDAVVASPLTPASTVASEPAADDFAPQMYRGDNDADFETMDTDTMNNNDLPPQQKQSAPLKLPTPTGIELLVKETSQKMAFPEGMDEEVMQFLDDSESEGMATENNNNTAAAGEVPTSPVIVKMYWNSMLRSRFDNNEINQLVEREVSMVAGLKKVYTLKECIDMYTQQEQLNEEDSWYCPECKTHRRAFKKLDLWALPQILIIHLKRFIYSRYTRDKIETELEIPIRGLDFGDKVLNPAHSQAKYDLIGISNHSGGLGSGHYTACALNGTHWCDFNDSTAIRVNADVPDTFTSREAYMLFYRRRDTTRGEEHPPTPNNDAAQHDEKEGQQPQQQEKQLEQ